MDKINNKLVDELFAAGAHFGYSKSKRHPTTKENILTNKKGVDIINLEKTALAILEAKKFLTEIHSKGGKVLFLANKKESRDFVKEVASSFGFPYVSTRWIGGTLTNFSEIRKRSKRLQELMDSFEKGELTRFTKKERLNLEREVEKLKRYYIGLLSLNEKPKVIFVVDSGFESIAVKEAKETGVKIISISSTDCNLSKIDFPIAANDASAKTTEIILKELVSDFKKN